MNKYWQKTLQDTVGKTVTGLSDSAARLKQGWGDKQQSPEPSSQSSSPRGASVTQSTTSPEKQQYLRLPLESARKLRWYDREDVSGLVESSLRDKKQLHATIAALRQALQDRGISEAELDDELKERVVDVEKQAFYDEGVASVLLASLQAEAQTLKADLETRVLEVEDLKTRLEANAAQPPTSQEPLHIPAEPSIRLQIIVQEAMSQETPQVRCHRPTASAFEDGRDEDAAHVPLGGLPEAADSAELLISHRATDDGADGMIADASVVTSPSGQGQPNDDAIAALLGKLSRVEEERREYFEEIARLNDLLGAHERSAAETRDILASLRADLEAARKGWADAEESGERRFQDLKTRVGATQSQHAEMLRRAQDICIEAEERSAALERRADKAELRATRAESELNEAAAEVKRLTADLKARDKERESLMAEARQRGEVEKGGALSTALAAVRKASEEREAELRKAMREGEAKLRERIQALESDNADLRRSLAKAEAEVDALEARCAEAEETEAHLQRDLRAAEAAAGGREDLEAHVVALQERLEETRAERGQLANYKQIAKELEAERAKVEEQVVATVRIATSLEARLQAAHAAKDAAEHLASVSERRAAEAEKRVEKEVARRLEVISADETLWPRGAQETVARQSQKLEAVHKMLAGLQNELDTEQHRLAEEQAAKANLQARFAAAEERAGRSEWEAKDAIQKLERKVSALQAEASEWRREAAASEAEYSRLSVAHRKPPAFQRTSSTGSWTSTPRRGGGNLHGFAEADSHANGNGHLLGGVDILYLKNVVLKFLDAMSESRFEQCEVLLPAIATLVRASPQEFSALKGVLDKTKNSASWRIL